MPDEEFGGARSCDIEGSADPRVWTGTFRLVCDGSEPPELEIEETDVITAPAEPLVVPVGPAREGDPRA